MYCPRCGDEFRDGFTRCSGCDVDLIAELPSSQDDADLVLVPVFETSDVNLVAMLKLVFEDAGIELDTRNEGLQDVIYGRMAGFNPVAGPIEFRVREDDEETARELIEHALKAPVLPSDAPVDAVSPDAPEELPAEANDQRQSAATQASSRPRRRLKAIAAVTLNICVLPMFYLSIGLILGETAWGERHLSAAMWVGFVIAVVLATVTCIAWLTRPKLAAWLQVLPLIPMLWSFIAQRTQQWDGAGSFDRLKEYALLIIATVFAAFGVVAIASAILPRIMTWVARR